jgi:hypothetical protein
VPATTRENVRLPKADEAARGPVEREMGVERDETKTHGHTGRGWKPENTLISFGMHVAPLSKAGVS